MTSRPIPPEIRDWVEIVVADNANDLLSYLRRRVQHQEDAADLLGRVLLALWEKSARLPTNDLDARMWCFGIARNILREHYRHAVRELALVDGLRSHLRTSSSEHGAADGVAEEKMDAEAVRQALGALDRRSRELLILIHWDGFTIADAARLLSMNESTARTRHARALRRLERELEPRGKDAGAAQATRPGRLAKPALPPAGTQRLPLGGSRTAE